MSAPALTSDQNILPVQAYFNLDGSFNTFIGQGHPFVVSATESIGINNVTTNATFYPVFSPVSSGQVTSLDVFTGLTYNPSTGLLTTTALQGNLKGIADLATNLVGSYTNALVYQSTNNTTSFIANGTTGQYLSANTSGAPTWVTPTFAGSTVTDDTSTNATRYPLFSSITSGNLLTEYTSSTKYQFNPNTGALTATSFVGSGASLTSIPNGALVNSSITVGTTSISLGSSSTTLAGLSSVTSTTFVGALTGNASSATTATSATVALNVQVTDSTSSSSTFYPTLSPGTTGSTNYALNTSSTKLSFVPNTGTLTATNFSGLASSATNIAGGVANQIIYQTGAGATSFITAPSSSGTYLEWNGSAFVWATPGGGGTVTSVAQSFTGGLISVSGSPITSSGTLALTVAGTSGGIPYFSSGTTWASSGALSQYSLLVGGGAGNAPTSLSSTGTANQVLISNGSSANPTFTSALTGLTIDNTVIGGTTPSTGTFTTITGQTANLTGTGQNLYLYSQAMPSGWGSDGATVSNPGTVSAPSGSSPFGGTDGNIINEGTGVSTNHDIYQQVLITQPIVTISAYFKNPASNGRQWVALSIAQTTQGNNQFNAVFDLVNGTVTKTNSGTVSGLYISSSITPVGNGWYRCSVTGSFTTYGVNFYGLINMSNSATPTITGFGNINYTGTSQTMYAWGVQLNYGYTASNYIQTTSSAVYGYPYLSLNGNIAVEMDSSGNLILQPAGTGALQAQQTTSSATGGNARGTNAVDWQTSRTAATMVASAQAVIAGGQNNTASGTASSALGGYTNLVNANYATAVGGSYGTTRGVIGLLSIPASNQPLNVTTAGSTQSSMLVIGVQTTNATATALKSNTSAASATNQLVLPNGQTSTVSVYTFRALVSAHNTGTIDAAGWEIKGVISRGAAAANTALVGTPSVALLGATTGAITAGWGTVSNVAAVADTTNGALQIQVTGAASTTINWSATIETNELGY